MRVIITDPALQDLDGIADYQNRYYPASTPSFD